MHFFRKEISFTHKTYFIGLNKISSNIDKIKLEFPDGTIKTVNLLWKRVNKPYGDMGHTYDCYSDIPFIEINYHGVPVFIEIDENMKGEFV